MTINYLHQDSQEQGGSDLPLLKNWCKDQTKEGKDPYEQPLTIRGLKESRSGEWLVAELSKCIALIPAKSVVGKSLLELMPKLSGMGNRLVIIPHKKGKLGFSVGVDDSIQVHYKWNEDENYLWCSGRDTPPQLEASGITLEAIMSPTSPQVSEKGQPKNGRGKPKEEPSTSA